ncbi:TPA: F0F1 ATP synthase subunit B [Photobacterium damselae]|uniref:ATP synthase subunit b n=1 Tax=Photobacterium damselae TaxID=38293 RepID=A0ABD6X7D5_PHODM|nr:F0F1 ATP synthase subunit B [Photobacterium damselae]OBU43819.1 F0F1 ATP synthase subunit B [Photobacterium damselae]PSU18707.1 F0F1 ATP synthase subunit B [Photobacterium damselae]TLS68034.1 F0F1 ATP synthase subunit B [Photobacterium damselae subsp. damselae]UJZ95701.1 F0F1 ATP synthase subunit B [Photobacterium damselae subsp. damselae]UKA00393.1 F0F1 ATP synthase subunit B [Photobacterium damselae subsp. damselae]
MNLNATMLGQAISFVIFVWLCMKYIWPPLTELLDKRQREIAEGLIHTENAAKELELARANGDKLLNDAKKSASELVEQGNKRRSQIIDDAKAEAEAEKTRIIAQGQAELESERNRIRQELRREMSDLVIETAEKLINQNLDSAANRELVNKLIKDI